MDTIQDIVGLLNLTTVPMAGLVTYGVISIFRGTWTPDRITKAIEAERDKWMKAYELERDAHAVTRNQNTALLQGAKTTEKVLSVLPEIAGS